MPYRMESNNNTVSDHIHRLKDGCILLSSERLEDPNFKVTVVLICIYNKEGAFGLVCNRPSNMPLSEVFDLDSPMKEYNRNIYIGGPVQQEALNIVQLSENAAEHAYKIFPGVYLGGEWETLESILLEDTATTRLFLGYSGWAPGQLEMEITEGAWEAFNVNVEKFLRNWERPMFQDIYKIREYLSSLSQENQEKTPV